MSLELREAQRDLGRLSGDDVRLDVTDGLLVGDRVTIRGNLKELGLRNEMAANVVGIHGTTLRVERNGRVVDVDTSASDEHRKVEHGYCRTTFREQGATRLVELAMLTRHENSASFTVGFSRHMDAFEAFYSLEQTGTYDRLAKMAQHAAVKMSAHDVFAVEAAAAIAEQQRRDHERSCEVAAEEQRQEAQRKEFVRPNSSPWF